MTLPILEGSDGKIRMGKSKGNYIALTESARDQFGKTMRIPDELIARWARLADFQPQAACEAIERGIRDGSRSPLDEKKALAHAIVTRYHGADAARDARDYFERTIQRRELPAEIPEMPLGACEKVAEVMLAAGFADSKRAARGLIAEGAVRIDGVAVTDPGARWTAVEPAILQVGSRRFVRVFPNER
jgi:tyrosyl-tRNA synthetase